MATRRLTRLTYTFAFISLVPGSFSPALMPEYSDTPKLPKEVIECTTGVATGAATQDGRPLLWKNRDLEAGLNQAFHYVADMGIPFISVTTSDLLVHGQYYGGVNARGFAIENSNAYNVGPGVDANGWGSDSDDGFVQALALATCTTVDDFQAILDSTNRLGRTHTSNYGVIDAYGGAAIFESAAYNYMRWDAAEAPGGFLVRSNFSYWDNRQDTAVSMPAEWGQNRHNSAYNLFKTARENGYLTAEYIFQDVARDLYLWGVDARPLPFEGYYGNNPYGWFPVANTVCRFKTRSMLVVQGVTPGETPDDAILWAMCGSPLSAVATPLWVRAGSVPEQYYGPDGSTLCNRSLVLRNFILASGGDVADTRRLSREDGKGLWDFTLPLERWVFSKTYDFVRSPNFSYEQLATFQNRIAAQVQDSLDSWKPYYDVTEIVLGTPSDHGITLNWEPEPGIPGDTSGREFRIYRSNEPFREMSGGELVGVTEQLTFTDAEPFEGTAFYRVESVSR